MTPLEAGFAGLLIGVVITSALFWMILENHND